MYVRFSFATLPDTPQESRVICSFLTPDFFQVIVEGASLGNLKFSFSSSPSPIWRGQPSVHQHSAPPGSVLRPWFFLPLRRPSFPRQPRADFSFAWLRTLMPLKTWKIKQKHKLDNAYPLTHN